MQLYFDQLIRCSPSFGTSVFTSLSLSLITVILNAIEPKVSSGMFETPLSCCCFSFSCDSHLFHCLAGRSIAVTSYFFFLYVCFWLWILCNLFIDLTLFSNWYNCCVSLPYHHTVNDVKFFSLRFASHFLNLLPVLIHLQVNSFYCFSLLLAEVTAIFSRVLKIWW